MLKAVAAKSLSLIPMICAVGFATQPVRAQEYPTKPIRVLANEISGGADVTARLVGQGISVSLGQPVIIDNRGSRFVGPLGSKAAPDGYTLIVGASTFLLGPLLEKTTYDPIRDFTPITNMTRAPNVLIVHPSLPVKSVKDLIALAKAKPKQLNYASGSNGSSAHLSAELFNSMAKVDIVSINYKGTGQALTDVMSGQVQMMITAPGGAAPLIKSGRVRALGVTSLEPSRLMPGVPTVAASLPGYEFTAKTGMLAPAGTPAPIIHRLNQEMVRVLAQPDAKEKLLAIGLEANGTSPEEFGAMMKSDVARIGKLIKDAGITVE